ncbi:MAG: hypothetical protein Q8N53_18775 [Longimicrobiales bacterium]|nr:hypothetical protein [Longimicrobiales bacterium]
MTGRVRSGEDGAGVMPGRALTDLARGPGRGALPFVLLLAAWVVLGLLLLGQVRGAVAGLGRVFLAPRR